MNLIQQYISQTPAQLQKIVSGSKELFASVANRDIKRVIITGSGTSYHSGLQMQSLMRKRAGIEVLAFYPFMLTPDFFIGDNSHTLVIGISQGGSSFSTFDAMKNAKAAGCIIGTMAGEKDAYIDSIADEIMTVNIGEEKAGAKTKGYYATKLNLLLLADYLGLANGNLQQADFNQDLEDLNNTMKQFPHAYQRALDWVEEHKEKLAKTDNLRVVGPAMLYGDVLEGSLKVLETCRLPITGYDFDEFIHGIYNAMNEKASVLILDNGTEPRCNKMIEVLGDWTNNLYLVDTSDAYNGNHFGYDVTVPKDFETFIYPLILQVMASIVSPEMGFDPNSPKDPNFHMKLGSKKFNG
ncbi:SIS domain-containing protein [Lactobacillus sp. ESL0684]|uniref:SIS domain-containing protein n=1 Tax=unclassified Lactobacillus TaxID=2620435 RepID=UPI0023F819A5|nr:MULTISPECIES: SIS domain-containing protein [unclassified Lactobacillus]WEV40064.1 SIS domain-containing protein [Lactobacillus sp. ESL0681]WEV43396.1 SIS domain-containing protein [Lactobacillus sp. ESL0684]